MYKVRRTVKNNAKAKIVPGVFEATITKVKPAEGFVDDSVVDVFYNVNVNGKIVETKERFALDFPSERNDRLADALAELGCETLEDAIGKKLVLHYAYEFTSRGKYCNIVQYEVPMAGGDQE